MKKQKQFILSLFIVATALLFFVFNQTSISASDATITITPALDNQSLYANLDGEWVYFDQELLSPQEAGLALNQGLGKPVKLPAAFKDHSEHHNNFGTYAVYLKLPRQYISK